MLHDKNSNIDRDSVTPVLHYRTHQVRYTVKDLTVGAVLSKQNCYTCGTHNKSYGRAVRTSNRHSEYYLVPVQLVLYSKYIKSIPDPRVIGHQASSQSNIYVALIPPTATIIKSAPNLFIRIKGNCKLELLYGVRFESS